ncbi:hypothetical protein [Sulfitobacter sp. 1A12056]|uniref:5-methylcytosine restriction system specificity protein McrC n=1 Tax=Sulfitobacter TaxID=60136 RepID=UPI003746E071
MLSKERHQTATGPVSQSDVYQLMAYSQLYDCNRVMLLYPHHQGLPSEPVCKPYDIASPTGTDRLFVSTVDVSGAHSSVAAALIATMQKSARALLRNDWLTMHAYQMNT